MKKLFLILCLLFFTITTYTLAEDKKININCTCQNAKYEETLGLMTDRSCEGSYNDIELDRLSGNFKIFDPPLSNTDYSKLFLAEPFEAELFYSEGSPNYYKWKATYRSKINLEKDEIFYTYHEFKIQINRININTTLDYRVTLNSGEVWPKELSYNDSRKLQVLYQCHLVDNLL